SYGKEALENWLIDAQDWCVSQQRYWGIPMPVWVCSKCKAEKVIGSVEELKKNAVGDVGKLDDLHRHSVDHIELKCSCGGKMKRVPDIFNVWFDSGISPWASLGYPFKNEELFESMFPISLVCESQDQIRGWFYSLLFCAVSVFDKKSYEKCCMMGWVLDEKGEKMSKSLGNVVYATDALDQLGGDALRWYYAWDVAPWDVQKFSVNAAKDVSRTLGILFNSYAFFDMYKAGWKPGKATVKRVEDKWILSRLNTVTNDVTNHFEEFEFHKAGRLLADFVSNDFSRWYIKLIRDRVWVSAKGEDKQDALNAMHAVLLQTTKLLAPLTPFISEWLYQRLHDEKKCKSVHYCAYPVADKKKSDAALEKEMALVMQATEALNSLRQEAGVKLRWPVARVIFSGGKEAQSAVKRLGEVITSMNNALAVEFVEKPAKKKTLLVRELSPELTVILDSERTPELENQALYRELIRAIQEARKKNGFVVEDKIALTLEADKAFASFLKARTKELESEVGASSVSLASLKGEFKAEAAVEGKVVKAAFSKAIF
ncbi:MAG: class I tRNA ligase family protein, partial [Candidatus Micrarchaeota archaeon]